MVTGRGKAGSTGMRLSHILKRGLDALHRIKSLQPGDLEKLEPNPPRRDALIRAVKDGMDYLNGFPMARILDAGDKAAGRPGIA